MLDTTVHSEMRFRALLAESTDSLGRLAGGILHEINSPLGALSSGVQTLMALARKQTSAAPSDQPRLTEIQDELGRSLLGSLARLQQVVGQVRELASLEDARTQPSDLNRLLIEVADMLRQGRAGSGTHFQLDLDPLPPVACRPRQMSAVFAHLLRDAIEAAGDEGRIRIASRELGGSVEITLRDSGRSIPPNQLAALFHPGFAVSHERVAARNWGLFCARQIVLAHGGDISVESTPGAGTTVRLTLPLA